MIRYFWLVGYIKIDTKKIYLNSLSPYVGWFVVYVLGEDREKKKLIIKKYLDVYTNKMMILLSIYYCGI
jgi:hypothetical protein